MTRASSEGLTPERALDLLRQLDVNLQEFARNPATFDAACKVVLRALPMPLRWAVKEKGVRKVLEAARALYLRQPAATALPVDGSNSTPTADDLSPAHAAAVDALDPDELLAAQCFFGLCWMLGVPVGREEDDPGAALFHAFIAGTTESLFLSEEEHVRRASSLQLARTIVRSDKRDLLERVDTLDEAARWRPGLDLDSHLPSYIARAHDAEDRAERTRCARGLVLEGFRFAALTATACGGRDGNGVNGMVANTARYVADHLRAAGVDIGDSELIELIEAVKGSQPGSNGIFLAIAVRPDSVSAVLDELGQLPFPLVTHTLDDHDLVQRIVRSVGGQATHRSEPTALVMIPFVDEERPDDVAALQQQVRWFAEQIPTMSSLDPPYVVDDPDLVSAVAGALLR